MAAPAGLLFSQGRAAGLPCTTVRSAADCRGAAGDPAFVGGPPRAEAVELALAHIRGEGASA